MYRESIYQSPPVAPRQPETHETAAEASLIATQNDIKDVVLICAKHLAPDNQAAQNAIQNALETNNTVSEGCDGNVKDLVLNVHQSVARVAPSITVKSVEDVIRGILQQFRDVAKLTQ